MDMALQKKPLGRSERKKQKTRTDLLNTAYRLMSKDGVDETTIAEISELSDVAFGTFYNYFKSKDEIAACVLDCVIKDLGGRLAEATEHLRATDPAAAQAISMRIVLREMLTSPMWRSWLKKTDLLVERMNVGFYDYAERNTMLAIQAGDYDLDEKDVDTVLSQHTWMMVGGVKSILDKQTTGINEKKVVEGVLCSKGLPRKRARELTVLPLPKIPPHQIDFSYL
jgi:AcrR family transcriptional regulator